MRHGLLVRKPCFRCLASLDDVKGLRMESFRTMPETNSAREVFKECMEGFISTDGHKEINVNQKRKERRVVKIQSFESNISFGNWCLPTEYNDDRNVCTIHIRTDTSFHLDISRLLKEVAVSYPKHEKLFTEIGGEVDRILESRRSKGSVLR